MRDLMLIGLGPVQDFIASARRCQDLWFGSYLLSELSRAAATAIAVEAADSETLIFPPSPEEENVANKILCRVPAGRSEELAQHAHKAVLDRLHALAEDAYAGLPTQGALFMREVAFKQLDDLVEWQWVSTPLEEESGYRDARATLEDLFARAKLLRPWRQPTWKTAAGTPKSSIDGQRESVLHEKIYDQTPPHVLRRKYGVESGERLCGVGLLKRRGADRADEGEMVRWETPAFHSTSHVAAGPVLTRIARHPDGEVLVRRYLEALASGWEGIPLSLGRVTIRASSARTHDGRKSVQRDPLLRGAPPVDHTLTVSRVLRPQGPRGVDGVVLFEDRLRPLLDEAREEGNGLPLDAGTARRWETHARSALGELLRGLECPTPTPYFALLLADGDRMGKALDRLDTMDAHRTVSKALEGFAQTCGTTVERFGGSLLYAGGDDVFALLPLHTALQCARQLAEDFRTRMWATAAGSESVPADERPTLSVGIAIAHHLEPLSDVRALAKTAEKLAKRERNSLAIIVQKRSGGRLSVSRPWGERLDDEIWNWVRALGSGEMPDSAAFELERAVAMFDDDSPAGASAAVLALARRALQRRLGASDPGSPLQFIENRIDALSHAPEGALQGVRVLSTELQIAREFHAAWRVAWAPTEHRGEP